MLVEHGKTGLALSVMHFEFRVNKQFYEGRLRLLKLLHVGILMRKVVKKMVEREDGSSSQQNINSWMMS